MRAVPINTLLAAQPIGDEIDVWGWVKTRRDSGAVSFLEVNDGSCLASLQVVVEAGEGKTDTEIKKITTGAAVHVQGTMVESPAKGQQVELAAKTIEVIGSADPETYPLQKKRHSFEFLRTISHLRSRTL